MVYLENALWTVYREQGLTVLGVDVMESAPLVASWIELRELTYPIVISPTAEIYLLFSTGPFPHNAIVDRSGVLRHSSYGFDLLQIESLVQQLLEEDPPATAVGSWSDIKALY